MTLIEKNIIVVDKYGNKYEATYPKRAKGLVKNGRACFINENKICLLCPPNIRMEDYKMSENTTKKTTEQNTKNKKPGKLYNVDYILSKLAEIQVETSHLNEAIAKLSAMSDGDSGTAGSPGNTLGAEKAKAFGDIVRCRETTNQQLIRLYEKMYDNLIFGGDKQIATDKWNAISKIADAMMVDDDWVESRENIVSELRYLLKEN